MNTRQRITAAAAGLLILALPVLLGAGGFGPSAGLPYEGTTAPGDRHTEWIDPNTRQIALYDTTLSEFLFEPVIWVADRNAASFSGDWLRIGGNGIPMDTAGVAANTLSAGIPVKYDSRIMGVEGALGGNGATAPCTLYVFRTEWAATPAETILALTFTGSGIHEWPESTAFVEGDGVLSFYLSRGTGAGTYSHPVFLFRLCRSDTLP